MVDLFPIDVVRRYLLEILLETQRFAVKAHFLRLGAAFILEVAPEGAIQRLVSHSLAVLVQVKLRRLYLRAQSSVGLPRAILLTVEEVELAVLLAHAGLPVMGVTQLMWPVVEHAGNIATLDGLV